MDGISKLLSNDGFIVVNKSLIRELGLHEAIMIGELCSEYNYWEKCNKLDDEMFYSTRDNIEYNTGLNEHYQRKALTTLKEKGIISITKKGLPAVNYYKINFDKILSILSTSSASREELDVKDIDLNNNKTEISKQKNNSKELLQNSTPFEFGKKPAVRESLYKKCISLIDNYTIDTELRKVLVEYLRVRLEMKDKPIYVGMWKGLLNKLDREFDTSERLAVVRQSIERGYASFFPINSYSTMKNKPWEQGVKSEGYTEEEKRQIEKDAEEMEARGERVWY